IYAQIFARLKFKLDFGSLDILKNNIVICRPGPRKAKKPLEAIIHIVLGMAIAAGIAIESTDTWLPTVLEGMSCLKGITMSLVALPTVTTKLIDQVEVIIQPGIRNFSIAT